MKKLLIIAVVLLLAVSLAACGGKEEDVTLDLDAIAGEISGANLFVDAELQPVAADSIAGMLGLDASLISSAQYYMGAGATGEEWGLFECVDAASAETLLTQLEAHRDDLLSTYESYAPDAVPRIENAVIMAKGRYAVFITAEQYAQAQSIAGAHFA